MIIFLRWSVTWGPYCEYPLQCWDEQEQEMWDGLQQEKTQHRRKQAVCWANPGGVLRSPVSIPTLLLIPEETVKYDYYALFNSDLGWIGVLKQWIVCEKKCALSTLKHVHIFIDTSKVKVSTAKWEYYRTFKQYILFNNSRQSIILYCYIYYYRSSSTRRNTCGKIEVFLKKQNG